MYHPYRGKRARMHQMLKSILIALLCLFILACIVFLLFFLNKDTVSIFGRELTLPWSQAARDGQQPDTIPDDELNFEILPGENGEQTPEPPPAVADPVAKVIEIPAGKAHDAAYIAQVAQLSQKGFTTAAITIKDQTGSVTGVDGLKPSLDTLHAAGMQVTAIFYAYEDDTYAGQNKAASLQNTARDSWRTGDGKRWLDPASAEANAYLAGNIRACKNAGFDEIVLRSFGWPAAGRLDRIVYGESDTGAKRADALIASYQTLAAEAAPTKLSVMVDNPTVEGGLSEASGQDLAKLYAAAARVYVPMAVQSETSGDSIRTIVGRLTGDTAEKLVPMYSDAALAPSLLASTNAFYFTAPNGDLALLLQ